MAKPIKSTLKLGNDIVDLSVSRTNLKHLENNFNTDLDDIFISPNFIKGYMNKHIEIRKENTDTYYNKMLEYFANLGYKIESY